MTARLDESVVEALDRAVDAGLAATRGAVIAQAVGEWLERHGEEGIIASYRRRYGRTEPHDQETIAALAAFSVAACLADEER